MQNRLEDAIKNGEFNNGQPKETSLSNPEHDVPHVRVTVLSFNANKSQSVYVGDLLVSGKCTAGWTDVVTLVDIMVPKHKVWEGIND